MSLSSTGRDSCTAVQCRPIRMRGGCEKRMKIGLSRAVRGWRKTQSECVAATRKCTVVGGYILYDRDNLPCHRKTRRNLCSTVNYVLRRQPPPSCNLQLDYSPFSRRFCTFARELLCADRCSWLPSRRDIPSRIVTSLTTSSRSYSRVSSGESKRSAVDDALEHGVRFLWESVRNFNRFQAANRPLLLPGSAQVHHGNPEHMAT